MIKNFDIYLKLSREYKKILMNGQELLRIGFIRFNFNYFMTEEDITYLIKAIEFVCGFYPIKS